MRKASGTFNKITPTNRKYIRKSASRADLRGISEKVLLKHVLGLTTTNTNGLAYNPALGLVAYPAGCVIVLYNASSNTQSHISNPDRKTITCLSFSTDGKYLASGETGQQPSVRIWELGENITQVAELPGHKSGITCVEFSPNGKLIVSIGDQHDMLVNVWNWKLGHTVACNKSGCRVRAVSFSETGNYLVTVGNRHVKFWYLDTGAPKGNAPVAPINGRSGILGDQRNNCFTDVQCGVGKNAKYTYCVTKSSMLCMFGEKRTMDKWVELKAGSTNCLVVTEKYIFCGCADGVVRVFSPDNLSFVATFPRPHNLGVNVDDGLQASDLTCFSSKGCPDVVAVKFDKITSMVACVYNDHSLYIWNAKDINNIVKVTSFLYHSACIWGVETYPYFEGNGACLPYGSFLTCSSDDTIRIWNLESGSVTSERFQSNLYSKKLLKIVYIDEGLANLQDTSMAPFGKDSDHKNGIRCMQISPDGQVLATGDRSGNLRIYSLQFFEESYRIEAHESEILCVEFSSPKSGQKLLASSSRDRLIHIFDRQNDYTLLQTIDDHNSSITAVRFNYDLNTLQLLSCGADKIVMFHTGQVSDSGQISFVRNTIVPGKATLYDMGIEPTRKYAATVGQDRNLRMYDIQGAKQLNCFKGSLSEGGNLIKLQLDPGGVYAAISCSDKTISVVNFSSGDCEAAIQGHSELVTGLKFTADGKHLISVAGDGCIFVWSLPDEFTENICSRLQDLDLPIPNDEEFEDPRRKTFVVQPSISDVTNNELMSGFDQFENSFKKSPAGYRFSVGQLPLWAQKQMGEDANVTSKNQLQPLQGRWGEGVLNVVPEQQSGNALRRYSHDSSDSQSNELSKENIEQQQKRPLIPEDEHNSSDKTFYVSKNTAANNNIEDAAIADGDEESDGSLEQEGVEEEEEDSDFEGQFSPLIEHFEDIATPSRMVAEKPSDNLTSLDELHQQHHILTNRASISAKFLSRSQRSSALKNMTGSSLSMEEKKRRIEMIKGKLNAQINPEYPCSTSDTEEDLVASLHDNTFNNRQQRHSIDVSSTLPRLPKSILNMTRQTISSNLKKSKAISKSCQNLSFSQELDELQNRKFQNAIPTSPSMTAIGDVLDDHRRSSTPAIKPDKWKRRSINNLNLETNRPTSPSNLFFPPSPVHKRNHSTSDTAQSKNGKPPHNKGIKRRSNSLRRQRPRSLLIESTTVIERELSRSLSQEHQYHSDGDQEKTPFMQTNNNNSISSPVANNTSTSKNYKAIKPNSPQTHKTPQHQQSKTTTQQLGHRTREIAIDEQQALLEKSMEMNQSSHTSIMSEINDNINKLKMQALLHKKSSPPGSQEPISASQLIRLYDMGIAANSSREMYNSSPPERDTPHTPTTSNGEVFKPVEHASESTRNVSPIEEKKDLCASSSKQIVSLSKFQESDEAVKNLMKAYLNVEEIISKTLSDDDKNSDPEILTLFNEAFSKLQKEIARQQEKLNFHILKQKHSDVMESESFREIKKIMATSDQSLPKSSQENSVQLINVLDKYSSLLLQLTDSKLKS